MRFTQLLLNSTALTLLNWLLFVSAFCWASILKNDVLWWQDLHWHSWLTELEAVVLLRMIPAGSIWILWLLLSSLLTIMWLTSRFFKVQPSTKTIAEPVLEAEEVPDEMESDPAKERVELSEAPPELREKILRLHESLNKI
jgi:hypothetical protein